MKFKNRETQFPGKKKIIKVDANNVPLPGEAPIIVNVYKDEGTVYAEGTPITAENLNKGNWRDDESLSFKQRNNNNAVTAKAGETQIITDANGKTFVVPPVGFGNAKEINDAGSVVNVNGVKTNVNFNSDPQTQINNKVPSVNQPWKVYGTDGSSQQVVHILSDAPAGTTIPKRLPDGRTKTGYPSDIDDAANKKYVEDKVSEGARIFWSYGRDNAGVPVDLGYISTISVPNPPPLDSLIFVTISRGSWRTAATGFWTGQAMRMILPFETMTPEGSVGFRGRLHINPIGGTNYHVVAEVSEVASWGNTNWRWEVKGVFIMHYIAAIPTSNH